MRGRRWSLVAILVLPLVGLLAFATTALAEGLSLRGTVTIPGAPLKAWDISWFDRSTDSYYLADRTHAAVDVLAGATGTYQGAIGAGQFAGATGSSDTSGPDGVLVIPGDGEGRWQSGGELWAGDGTSTVKVFSLPGGRLESTISTGGTKRADEMAYDPADHILVVANDADSPPFVTFISTTEHRVLGHLPFPRATGGLEQPVWNPLTHLFYMSVPQVDGQPAQGEVAVIDPRAERTVAGFPVSQCGPTGLALGERQVLMVGCGAGTDTVALAARDGSLVARVAQVGGADELWYDPGRERYYVAGVDSSKAGVLGVVDAENLSWIENVPTAKGAHSVAADPRRGRVYVPLGAGASQCALPAQGCIAVFGR